MLTILESTSSEWTIPYPYGKSEFMLQAELFTKLKSIGFDVHGEYTVDIKETKFDKRQKCRFDLIVFVDKVHVVIIECKEHIVKHKNDDPRTTRQGQRYPKFGVPVWFVYGESGVNECVDKLSSLYPVSIR